MYDATAVEPNSTRVPKQKSANNFSFSLSCLLARAAVSNSLLLSLKEALFSVNFPVSVVQFLFDESRRLSLPELRPPE